MKTVKDIARALRDDRLTAEAAVPLLREIRSGRVYVSGKEKVRRTTPEERLERQRVGDVDPVDPDEWMHIETQHLIGNISDEDYKILRTVLDD